jgi:hypothetical protein
MPRRNHIVKKNITLLPERDREQPEDEPDPQIDDTATPKMAETVEGPTPPSGAQDFDLDRLRLSQDYTSKISVRKQMLKMGVNKPHKQAWIRVHRDDAYRLHTNVIELKGERSETFLVDPALWEELSRELAPRLLVLAITRQMAPFIWPIRLPGADGRTDTWSESALDASRIAQEEWVRVVANMDVGAYDVIQTGNVLSEPEWPTQSFKDLLRLGFHGKYIATLDHPVVRKLRGEE